jgi:predicted permease
MISDIRFAFRQLRKSAGFSGIAIASLAIGIGATTAVFSFVNAVLLNPLPVPRADELRLFRWSGDEVRMTSYAGQATNDGGSRYRNAERFNYPTFVAFREAAKELADVFAFEPRDRIIVRVDQETGTGCAALVSENFFSGLGLSPFVGRLWTPDKGFSAGPFEVVISHDWWQRHLGGRADAVGKILTLEGKAYTIVGILPPGFTGIQPGQPTELFLPMTAGAPLLYEPDLGRFHWFVCLVARLRQQDAAGRLQPLLTATFARESALARDGGLMTHPEVQVRPGAYGANWNREATGRQLLLLLGVTGLVLLTACANLGGLSLARHAHRVHELAVRAALGANRARLFRIPLIENLMLALAGGGLGAMLAGWGQKLIQQFVGDSSFDLALDARVLAFGLALTFATALLTGLLPGWRASRTNPIDGLAGRALVGSPRLRTGRILAILQIALAFGLLTTAGLALRTAYSLAHVDTGFPTERLLLVGVSLRTSPQAMEHRSEFHQRLQEELARLPGVRSASFIGFPLLSSTSWSGKIMIPGRDTSGLGDVCRLNVGDRFFATFGIPILQGRGFEPRDGPDAPKVLVVNEALARRFFPGENPLGRSIRLLGANFEIVGVCRDTKYDDLRAAPRPTTYLPFRQMSLSPSLVSHFNAGTHAIRTIAAPETTATAVRALVARLDPEVTITGLTTQDEVRAAGLAKERTNAALSGALAAVTVLLSCIGLYGLMAFNIGCRRAEFGIRTALGATRWNIAASVLRDGGILGFAGVALGLPTALVAARLTPIQLYGVTVADPFTLTLGALLLLATLFLACWLPARRACRVDPLEALRTE